MSRGTHRAAGVDVLAAEVELEGQERPVACNLAAGTIFAGIFGQLMIFAGITGQLVAVLE